MSHIVASGVTEGFANNDGRMFLNAGEEEHGFVVSLFQLQALSDIVRGERKAAFFDGQAADIAGGKIISEALEVEGKGVQDFIAAGKGRILGVI